VTVLIIAASPRKHALILQTTAGDAPRLFETRDEDFLDRLIDELTLRLESGGKLPPMVVNLQAKRINMGDTFKNISGSTIVNRAMVAESFNTVSRKYDQETAEAIQRIAEFIYEPQADGSLELVAVENLTFIEAWEAAGNREPPSFHGVPYDYMVDDPATPTDEAHHFEPHYDQHVWLYRENPNGVFAQFNPDVTCEHHGRETRAAH
jgi:hypothetical protein